MTIIALCSTPSYRIELATVNVQSTFQIHLHIYNVRHFILWEVSYDYDAMSNANPVAGIFFYIIGSFCLLYILSIIIWTYQVTTTYSTAVYRNVY